MLVAAVSAGLVATVTFFLAREYRWRTLRSTSLDQAQVALALAPSELDEESFERFRELYEQRNDADIVAVQNSTVYASAPNLSPADIPDNLSDLTGDPVLVEATVDGRRMLVAGANGRDDASYYLYFSLDQFEESLHELAQVALLSWFVTLVVAAGVGWMIARRTLKPVAEAASAAEAIAKGDLAARLSTVATDEFGSLATSFNHMADEVQDLIRRLEDAARRERRFTADVAHELRTPLTGLAASAAILRGQIDTLPMESRRPAAILVADVERLRDLVLELLELARLDASSSPPDLEPVDLRTAVDAVIASSPIRRSAHIELDIEPGLRALADKVRLRRILANFLDNALTHGGGTVTVRARANGNIHLDVIDDGSGVADDELDKVFDRFHKSDRSRASGGSGLGLAIARECAASQHGSVSVRNEPGRGACFSVELLPVIDLE